MKVLNVIQAQSVKAVRAVGGDYGDLRRAAADLTDRYHFLGVPKPDELARPDPNNGITFSRGNLEADGRGIVIDSLQVYAVGLSITTRSNTDDSDVVLADVLAWAQDHFKFAFEEIKPGIGHSSQLEVRLSTPLPQWFPLLAEVGAAISEGLDEFWETRPSYELINLVFWMDETKVPVVHPTAFRLDRRKNVPFQQEVYWSEAGLTTNKHIAILELLERKCLENLGR